MDSGTTPQTSSIWPSVLLGLWFLWLGTMVAMSTRDWNRPRPVRTPEELRQPEEHRLQEN